MSGGTERRWSEPQLARVARVDDPDGLDRVQVRLLSCDGPEGQDAPVWARVAVPTAGPGRGAWLMPDVGDEVLVQFINGDPRFPIVTGSLWSAAARAPDAHGGAGDRVDRWTLTGKNGSRVAIVEERAGGETITLSTPSGGRAELTAQGGGRITLDAAGSTITVDSSGVTVQTAAKVTVNGSAVEVNAGMVTVNAGMSTFNGVVKCDTLVATTVVASTYTPGAGNVW